MMTTAQRAKLKQSPELYKLALRIDANTRAVAKVVSAAEYLGDDSRDAWPLWSSLEALLHERRGMRRRMWGLFAVLILFAAPLACGQQATDGRLADAPVMPAEVTPAGNPINRWFVIAEGVRWGAAVADFETTRRYVAQGRCVESAPLLGREPSAARVYGVGAAFEVGASLASYLVQRHLRRHSSDDRAAALLFLEGGIAAAHAYSAAHNGWCL